MSEKKIRVATSNAVAQCSSNIYVRTMYMLPKPPLNYYDVLPFVLSEEQVAASRMVAKFNKPERAGTISVEFTYGACSVAARVKQPDEDRIYLPDRTEFPSRVRFDLMASEPAPWAEPFAHWVRQETDIFLDCVHLAHTVDALIQTFPMGDIKLLWKDMRLMTEVAVVDSYVSQAQSMFLAAFDNAPFPKRPITGMWPGLREDIERCRGTIGRALLADAAPKQPDIPSGAGWQTTSVYRNYDDGTGIIDVGKRAGVTRLRHYGVR